MVDCGFCNEPAAMAYKCRLCNTRHCGKHRLPETHECVNIGVFSTQEYRTQKLRKIHETRSYNSSADSYSSSTSGRSRFGDTWTTGDKYKDMVVGGLILGLVAIVPLGISGGLSMLLFIPFTMLFGVLYIFILYLIRDYAATKYGMGTGVAIYPIGVALTLILSIFRAPWILIGKFVNLGSGDSEKEAKIALYMVFGSLLINFTGSIGSVFLLSSLIDSVIDGQASNSIATFFLIGFYVGMVSTSSLFVMVAILTMLPFWGMEGTIIYEWNPRNYFITLAIVILSFIMFYSYYNNFVRIVT